MFQECTEIDCRSQRCIINPLANEIEVVPERDGNNQFLVANRWDRLSRPNNTTDWRGRNSSPTCLSWLESVIIFTCNNVWLRGNLQEFRRNVQPPYTVFLAFSSTLKMEAAHSSVSFCHSTQHHAPVDTQHQEILKSCRAYWFLQNAAFLPYTESFSPVSACMSAYGGVSFFTAAFYPIIGLSFIFYKRDYGQRFIPAVEEVTNFS